MKDKEFNAATKKLRKDAADKALNKVGRLATRTSAMAWFIAVTTGMLGAGAVITASREIKEYGFKDAVKNAVTEHNVLSMVLAVCFVSVMLSMVGNISSNARAAYLRDVFDAAGIKTDEDQRLNRAYAVYGMLLNNMTDAEYNRLRKLMDKWSLLDVEFGPGHNYDSRNIALVGTIVENVLKRNMGMREMLTDVLQGKEVAMLEFTQAGASVYKPLEAARAKIKDVTK